MPRPSVSSAFVTKINSGRVSDAADLLAAEEPMEIRLGFGSLNDRQQKSISVTMRTPGNDFELALGFLFTEGIINDQKDIYQVKHCTELNRVEDRENIVRVELNPEVDVDLKKLERNFYMSSSCGVCGKASIEAIGISSKHIISFSDFIVDSEIITGLPAKVRARQNVFEHTGGLHAAALFNKEGELIFVREDVGRHNALDKLIGAALSSGQLPFDQHILLLSGRTSFELLQKAVMSGIKIVAAIGAPSSLAVETAKQFDVTLIGFLRDERFNIYSGKDRINTSSEIVSTQKLVQK